jgi:hypothetical protein
MAGIAVIALRYLFLITLLTSLLAACGGADMLDDATDTGDAAMTATDGIPPTTTAAGEEATEPEAMAPTSTATPSPTPAAPDMTATPRTTLAPTASPTASAEPGFAVGWNVALRGDDAEPQHNRRVAAVVEDSGVSWVRFQVQWFAVEPVDGQWNPAPSDRMIEAMHAAGLNVLAVVAKAPDWAVSDDPETFLEDPAEFRELMAYLSRRYAGKVQAWEIWNEANLAHEVGGYVNVDDYLAMLEAGAAGVRAGDPNALVVFGGLTPNGVMDPTIAIDDVSFLELAYARSGGELSQWFDVLGAHAVSTHNPPDDNWPGPLTSGHEGWNDHSSFFFRRVEQLRQVMVAQGDGDKPVWITEFGWSTENQDPGREYAANNTEAEVAQFIVRALEIAMDEWAWCTGAFIWNLNWSTLTAPDDHKYPSSALYEDWTPRPAYEAVIEFLQERP